MLRPNHPRKRLLQFVLGMSAGLCCLSLFAKDLGTLGVTYPIAETNFITMAQKKMQATMSSSPGLNGQEQKAAILAAADRPDPVPGLHPTLHARHWLFDPSFTVPTDVRAADGRVLLKSGTPFNPLDKTRLTSALIFFDGDDPQQVAWVQKADTELKGRDLLILVQGSLHAVSSQFSNKRVYFDQGGWITQRLHITHVPAIVRQSGDQLEISEVIP